MKNLLYTVLMMCIMLHVSAQTRYELTHYDGTGNFRKRFCLVTLKDADGYKRSRGILVGTTDSTLLVSPGTKQAIQRLRAGNPLVQDVSVESVYRLVFRKKARLPDLC
jgi:hypothetical protein